MLVQLFGYQTNIHKDSVILEFLDSGGLTTLRITKKYH